MGGGDGAVVVVEDSGWDWCGGSTFRTIESFGREGEREIVVGVSKEPEKSLNQTKLYN